MTDKELDIICGMTDEEMDRRFAAAIRLDNEKKRIKGVPIQRYDMEKHKPYLEYPDGRREYAT